ncbi:Hypothetical Protein FCC1311_055502 [Hondaea fermentalgiana]|uniref:RGS domain-containing protein n=1 Tax=Hondaea fermentalgiana TaxID=2315210 RepID=A0A2R5GHX9_9STRA|nr:Hypothetical Protein FCC1311_055502 [Hondaea fermentalgiana]|eukprot:GBG29328.1 Hypothetical Protein FCC1311_055502 [Hondaea fermentalgiana]
MVIHIGTGSDCPFPYTYEGEQLEAWLANNTVNFGAENCTQTFAQYMGVGWTVFQVTMVTACTVTLGLYLSRLFEMKKYAKRKRARLSATVQWKIYVCGFICSLLLLVSFIDPFGARDLMPPEIYLLLDEVVSSFLFTLALFIVDFWAAAAKGLRAHQPGIPRGLLYFIIFITFSNFIGFEIAGIILHHQYFDFEAYKMFGAGTILAFMACTVRYSALIVERTLLKAHHVGNSGSNSSSNYETTGGSGSETSSTPGSSFKKLYKRMRGAGSSEKREIKRSIVNQLRAKNRKFYVVCFIVIGLAFANGAAAITADARDIVFKVDVIDTFVTLVVLKVMYFVALVITLHFFHVPHEKRHSKTSSFMGGDENSKTAGVATSARGGAGGGGQSADFTSFRDTSQQPPSSYVSGGGSQAATSKSFMSSLARGLKKSAFAPSSSAPVESERENSVLVSSIFDIEAVGWENADETDLGQTLNDESRRAAYRAFLRAAHAEEMLDCWEDIEKFEIICKKRGASVPEAQTAARRLVDKYIAPHARTPINISSANRSSLVHRKNSRRLFDATSFAKVKRELFETMREDTFSRFFAQNKTDEDDEVFTPSAPPA